MKHLDSEPIQRLSKIKDEKHNQKEQGKAIKYYTSLQKKTSRLALNIGVYSRFLTFLTVKDENLSSYF